MTLDRKDYKSAIPQLEKRLSTVENDTTKGLQGFDVLKASLEAEKLARQKAVLKVDEGIDLVTVKMFYALVDPNDYVGGLPPSTTSWSETMPELDASSVIVSGSNPERKRVLWYKSKTLRNGAVVNETAPQKIQLMDGVFSFVNSVSSNSGWTTIDGGSITTGIIQASQGDSFFNLNDGTFKVYSSATGQGLVWNGSNLTINGSITLTGHSDSLATEISNLQSGVTSASQTATSYITYINATDGIKVHDSADSSSYTKLNSNGMTVYKGGTQVATFGDTATIGKTNSTNTVIDSSGLTIKNGSTNLAKFKAGDIKIGSDIAGTEISTAGAIGIYPSGETTGLRMSKINGEITYTYDVGRFSSQPYVKAQSTNANISVPSGGTAPFTKVPMTYIDFEHGNGNFMSVNNGNVHFDYFDGFSVEATAGVYVKPSSNAFVYIFLYHYSQSNNTTTEVGAGCNYISSAYGGVVQLTPRIITPIYADDYLYISVRCTDTTATAYCNHKDTFLTVKFV